jgi:hypothetical protein
MRLAEKLDWKRLIQECHHLVYFIFYFYLFFLGGGEVGMLCLWFGLSFCKANPKHFLQPQKTLDIHTHQQQGSTRATFSSRNTENESKKFSGYKNNITDFQQQKMASRPNLSIYKILIYFMTPLLSSWKNRLTIFNLRCHSSGFS